MPKAPCRSSAVPLRSTGGNQPLQSWCPQAPGGILVTLGRCLRATSQHLFLEEQPLPLETAGLSRFSLPPLTLARHFPAALKGAALMERAGHKSAGNGLWWEGRFGPSSACRVKSVLSTEELNVLLEEQGGDVGLGRGTSGHCVSRAVGRLLLPVRCRIPAVQPAASARRAARQERRGLALCSTLSAFHPLLI